MEAIYFLASVESGIPPKILSEMATFIILRDIWLNLERHMVRTLPSGTVLLVSLHELIKIINSNNRSYWLIILKGIIKFKHPKIYLQLNFP
jgi:hypothetical protein